MSLRPIELAFLVLSLMFSGCVTTVDFSEGRTISPAALPTVQTFYDKQGDIYPVSWSGSDKKLTRNSDNSLMCGLEIPLCKLSHSTIHTNPEYSVQYEAWREIQKAENRRIVKAVLQKLETTSNKTIVMLIHGFRVSNAQEDYRKVKEKLLNNQGQDNSPVFLEVHWDGRDSPRDPISASWAWPAAQWTAPAVGFRLRPLLNELNEKIEQKGDDVDLLVLTHSTGAVIAGALFGNPTGALPCLENEAAADKCGPNYTEFLISLKKGDGAIPVPKWDNMNLVMLAAATSPATFVAAEHPEYGYQGSNNANLLFSHNKDDPALNKYVKFPSLLGYSGLGARLDDLKAVEKGLSHKPSMRANVTILEMSEELGREHSLSRYIETTEFSKVLDLLWNP